MAKNHSKAIERKLLASLLEYPEKQQEYLPKLSKKDFYFKPYRDIYQLYTKIRSEEDKELDSVTLYARANDNLPLPDITSTPTNPVQVESLFKNLRDLTKRRKLKQISVDIQGYIQDEDPIEEKAAEIEKRVLDLTTQMYDTDSMPLLSERSSEFIKHLDKISGPDDIIGIPTGVTELDRYTGGLQDGKYVIVAARPSMGKSDFMLDVALNAAREDKKALIFSIEGSWKDLMKRMASKVSGVHRQKIRRGTQSVEEQQKINQAISSLEGLDIRLDDQSTKISQIEYKTQKLVREGECDIVFVDYLGMIDPPDMKSGDRQVLVRETSKHLKLLAKSADIPVVVVSQLNRSLEYRKNKLPKKSDLRSSGGIEQDADLILFIHRPGEFDQDKPKDRAKLYIGKQREGTTGIVNVQYSLSTGEFYQ